MESNPGNCVISEMRSCEGEYNEYGDDDVFLDTNQVFNDIQADGRGRPLSVEVRGSRRSRDVIDSLGEDSTSMRFLSSSAPYAIPDSPSSRSDLGYGGSYTSSPAATSFSFPYGNNRRGISTTDARPVDCFDESSDANEVTEAVMPVSQESEHYNMDHPRRGHAIIFNHDVFDMNMAAPRLGSDVDVNSMRQVFTELGFTVTVYNNFTHQEIKEVIAALAKEDHSDADCLSIMVLTHGQENGLLYARDALYRVESLYMPFTADRCVTLAGKPKLFYIQACRGEKLDCGVNLVNQRRSMSETDCAASNSYKLPSYADFLISFSSMDGYYSWRNPDRGTWYVQSLAEELKSSGHREDLNKIMTRVHRRVALFCESFVPDKPWLHRQKQCPVYHSSLMRDLVFLPKP